VTAGSSGNVRRGSVQCRKESGTAGVDEALLVFARDVVKEDALEAQRGVLVQPIHMAVHISRSSDLRKHIGKGRPTTRTRDCSGSSDVGELIRCEDTVIPLVVCRAYGFFIRAGKR
jgi:hypothetical protein